MVVYVGKKELFTSCSFLKKAYTIHFESNTDGIDVVTNEYGKPFFNKEGMPFFSISHSGEFIACVFCKKEIGLDIQKVRRIPSGVVTKYLRTDSKDTKTQVIEWTKFESFGKRIGKGIPYDEDYSKGFFLSTDQIEQYIVTICVENENDQVLNLVYIDNKDEELEND